MYLATVEFPFPVKKLERLREQYCIKLDDTQMRTIQKAFGNNVIVITQIQDWYNHFKGAACQQKVTLVLKGLQQAEMMRS